jgi:hypothetical protein
MHMRSWYVWSVHATSLQGNRLTLAACRMLCERLARSLRPTRPRSLQVRYGIGSTFTAPSVGWPPPALNCSSAYW